MGGGRRRLLIVDDEPTIRFALSRYLSRRGFEVDATGEDGEARALMSACSYDFALLDLRLGGSGGYEGFALVRFLRERAPGTKIALLTAYGSPEVANEARRCGANMLIEKPVSLQEIDRILREHVEAPGPEKA